MSTNVLEVNPYAAPELTGPVFGTPVLEPVEQIRRDHLKIERAIKSSGSFYGLSSFITAVTAIFTLTAALNAPTAPAGMLLFAFIQAASSLLLGSVCVGLKMLRAGARWPAVLLALPLLLAFPVGSLISVYILYAVSCRKGHFVMTEQYREIVRQTPHVHRTSASTWIVFGAIVLLIVGAVAICVQF